MTSTPSFNRELAISVASEFISQDTEEKGLPEAFAGICAYISIDPISRISWRGGQNQIPSVFERDGLKILAGKYFEAFRRLEFVRKAGTVPDEMVTLILQEVYGYSVEEAERVKIDHQRTMLAENCVGNLLERYLDSVLRPHGWYWCCGSLVKSIDFILEEHQGVWFELQVKNRDNSENSSSSRVRQGTSIHKWFRSFSKKRDTNWDKLPSVMSGYGLSEAGFRHFVTEYIKKHRSHIDS